MVHCFSIDKTNIAVDVYSGAIHVLDDISYDVLSKMSSKEDLLNKRLADNLADKLAYNKPEIEDAVSELRELARGDMLFSDDVYAVYAKNWNKNSVVKALCLHVAHDCNLRCRYCFADTGSFTGQRLLMPYETGRKAIDFVIKNSGKRKNIEIDFFGGEPLLNFNVVKRLVEYADKQGSKYGKHFRYTLTTNGVLLSDDKIDYINEKMSNVVLSLDGRKEVNDRVRRSVKGSGSYDLILPKFKKLVDRRSKDKDYYVRGTYTAYNLDFSKDVLHIADLGFDQTSIEPVVEISDKEYAITHQQLEQLYEQYELLVKEYIKRKKEGRGFGFFHFMLDIEHSPCAIKRLSGCGAGHEYLAVTPDGDIYPCHQLVGNNEYKMGNVDSGAVDEMIKKTFEDNNIYTKTECKNCWAKFYCSGGCPANAIKFSADIKKPYEIACKLQKKRLECAIYAAAELSEDQNRNK